MNVQCLNVAADPEAKGVFTLSRVGMAISGDDEKLLIVLILVHLHGNKKI